MSARRRVSALLAAITVFVLFFALGASPAGAITHDLSVPLAQQSPYQPPDVTGGGGPTWLGPLAPLTQLPLWAQSALVAALAAVAFFVLQGAVRWAWRYVSDLLSRGTG
jgi:hypothetical protein